MSAATTGSAPPSGTKGQGQVGQWQPGPGGQVQAAGQSARRRWSSAQVVLRLSIVSTVMALLVGIVGFVGAQSQSAGMDRAAVGTDRVLTVMAVRNALLQADGAATNAFLVGGLEPQDRRALYDGAITQASMLLVELAAGASAGSDEATLIEDLNADLASYTSLVEAARVNNRQGFPVGAAYLDQASTLVREQMLNDLDSVLTITADEAAADLGTTNRAFLVVFVVGAAFLVLLVCQVRLAALTRRRLNLGLLAATVLVLGLGGPAAFISATAAQDAAVLRTDVYRPTLAIAQANVLAAESRTLESFTLIKRGSGAAYEEAFIEASTEANDLLASVEPALASEWQVYITRHLEIRVLDDSGSWDQAVALAIASDAGSPSAAYTSFSRAVQMEIDGRSASITDTLRDAASSARLASWLFAGVGLLAAILSWRGLSARREEYR